MSDILKEASMIKDQWKETLNTQGATVVEKVDPKDQNMTETKDSELIDQSSHDRASSIRTEEVQQSVVTVPVDFGKKPKAAEKDLDDSEDMFKESEDKPQEQTSQIQSTIEANPVEESEASQPKEPTEPKVEDNPSEIADPIEQNPQETKADEEITPTPVSPSSKGQDQEDHH